MGIKVTGGVKVPQGKFSVTANNPPTWTTAAGTIGTEDELTVVSFQFEASDPEQGTSGLIFTKISGDFPAGLSMDSAGLLTGTASDVVSDTTSNFTLRVTDSGGLFADEDFSMTINNVVPEVPETISGLVFWLDADDASTITESSNLVSNWGDKAGTANDAVASGSNRPTLVAALQNGKPGIDFTDNSDRMIVTAQSEISNIWSGGGYFICAVRPSNSPILSDFIIEKGKLEQPRKGWSFRLLWPGGANAAARMNFNQERTGGNGNWITGFVTTANTTLLLEVEYNQNSTGNNPIMRINGVSQSITEEAPVPSGSVVSDASTNMNIGNRSGNPTQGWNAPMFELIMYDEIPSSGDQTSLRTYFNDKWAIF